MSTSMRLSFVWILLTSPNVTWAEVVYSQTLPHEPAGAFSSQDTTSGQIVADNFRLEGTEEVNIRSIRLIGGRTSVIPSQPQNAFRVVFMEDLSGSPGDIVQNGDFDSGLLVLQSKTGGQLLNGINDPVEYSIDLGEGVSIHPGTDYWVTVMNDPGPGFGWLWARSVGTLDEGTAGTTNTSGDLTNQSWNLFNNGGMWFELSTQNVPEPSTIAIALAGVLVFAFRRRRRRFCCSIYS